MNKRWYPRSIRLRLTLWYTTALVVVLGIYATAVVTFLRSNLYAELDRQLHEDVEVAEQMLELTEDGRLGWRVHNHFDYDDDDSDFGGFVEVWSLEGELLYRRDVPGIDELSVGPPLGLKGRTTHISIKTNEGDPVRVLSAPHTFRVLPVVIRVARSERRLRRELERIILIMFLGFPFAVGIAGIGGYVLARRFLAPIGRMAGQAKTITAERLSERLLAGNPDDELGQLAIVFNETFARLERSFKELRRFTADASHELRTPLTAIRSVGEVGLREHRDEAAYREIIGSMLEEADRLARLVDSLLTLSRADAERTRLQRENVNLADIAREVAGYLEVLAEENGQAICVEVAESVYASVDRLILREAVINLLDNAIKYSPKSSAITIIVRHVGLNSVIEILDDGPGVPIKHRDNIFERFYRVDKARSREVGGTGLGLSIARWAVEANGGKIELETTGGKGSVFRIVLPTPQS